MRSLLALACLGFFSFLLVACGDDDYGSDFGKTNDLSGTVSVPADLSGAD